MQRVKEMAVKLTLALDEAVIQKAKRYASRQNISLSKLVEFYFSSLASDDVSGRHGMPPITAGLAGMVRVEAPGEDMDLVAESVSEKYL